MTLSAAAWAGIDTVLWSAGALACLIGAAWLMTRQSRFAAAGPALVFALLASAGWAIAGAVFGVGTGLVAMGEGLRNLAWIYAVYRLFAIDGRHAAIKPVRPLLATLAGVVLLQMAGDVLVMARDANLFGQIGLRANVLLHLLIAIGGLVLAHNLYSGASQAGRQILRWPAATLAMLWTVDLNHYAIAYLSSANPEVTGALRGLLGVPMAGLLVLGAGERSSDLRFMPSRVVAFQSISLLLIGGYLAALVAAAQWLAFAGSDYSSLLQIAFVAVAAVTVLALSGSARLRGWLRVTVLKHLFQHRYDYRVEWLRLTRTMGQSDADGLALDQRIIRGLADLTDSPAGLLLTPSEAGDFELAARWQWPTADVPAGGFPARLAQSIAQGGYIAEIDALRREPNPVHRLPDWLMADPRAWVVVPLLHFERMVGMVVLARPPHARQLDWEDFDLLRVVGRQLATYLAEQAGQAALVEAARFDEFNRRIAFVMHDIKNLASQMALLARNAESHADNPEFRADMLVTLRNSTDKLNALIARLSRYGTANIGASRPVRADLIAKDVVERLAKAHPVTLVESADFSVAADPDSLEQVLTHLIQNAIDASAPDAPVFVAVSNDGLNGAFEVVDSGNGMSPEFVRSRLYKPFESTKQGGFGIGAYEARELVKAMRGRIEVESREGLGTRFIVRLPLAEAAALYENFNVNTPGQTGKKVA